MDAVQELKWFGTVLLIIVIVWIWRGGYNSQSARDGAYLRPPTAIDEKATGYGSYWALPFGYSGNYTPTESNNYALGGSGSNNSSYTNSGSSMNNSQISTQADSVTNTVETINRNMANSVYKDKVTIDSVGSAYSSNVNQEYITISASSANTNKINISGWKIKSAMSGGSYVIGSGTVLPMPSQNYSEGGIMLSPGDRAYIITGRSPIGVSFKDNKCAGYFEQNQDFYPSISNRCPAPRDEYIPLDPHGFNDKCVDYIEGLSSCQTVYSLPMGITTQCGDWISKNVNYSGCVALHKNDKDFYGNEWRVYLGRNDEIWRNKREVIELIDSAGNIVDVRSY